MGSEFGERGERVGAVERGKERGGERDRRERVKEDGLRFRGRLGREGGRGRVLAVGFGSWAQARVVACVDALLAGTMATIRG